MRLGRTLQVLHIKKNCGLVKTGKNLIVLCARKTILNQLRKRQKKKPRGINSLQIEVLLIWCETDIYLNTKIS